jgi:hypothetical protein
MLRLLLLRLLARCRLQLPVRLIAGGGPCRVRALVGGSVSTLCFSTVSPGRALAKTANATISSGGLRSRKAGMPVILMSLETKLLRRIEECYSCAQTCTACADACLHHPRPAERRRPADRNETEDPE